MCSYISNSTHLSYKVITVSILVYYLYITKDNIQSVLFNTCILRSLLVLCTATMQYLAHTQKYFRFGNTPATAKLAMAYKNKYNQPVRNLPAPQKRP